MNWKLRAQGDTDIDDFAVLTRTKREKIAQIFAEQQNWVHKLDEDTLVRRYKLTQAQARAFGLVLRQRKEATAVRDFANPLREGDSVTGARALAKAITNLIGDEDREHVGAVYLDKRLRVIKLEVLFRGTLDISMVHPRDMFKRALDLRAAYVAFFHNHPSGTLRPSDEDRALIDRLRQVGDALGIHVVDSLVVGKGTDAYFSFKENGLM